MKYFKLLMGGALALLVNTAAFAQFDNKTPAFTEPGPGDKDYVYSLLVPEGITVTSKTGKVFKSGDTIGIPGTLITLMGQKDAEAAAAANEHFNNKSPMPKPEDRTHVMIALKVPEGVMIHSDDGRDLTGPAVLDLVVTAASMSKVKMTKPMGQDYVPMEWGSQ
ncbi:MAG: hypothetical protein H6970_15070 [Gammaproteobacteria bacterium]|nr:hypothetical protein [Gammaproteobacteria bacterium]MCP5458296.1 hypothetical protein [Gammaproteobacteria bacterium]